QLAAHLRSAALSGVVDLVPAARTVLVSCAIAADLAAVEAAVASFVPGAEIERSGILVEVPTVYDGDDLESVADTIGCSVAEVVELHSSTVYDAAFCGFVPGFAYLTGLLPALLLPRRQNPRPRVPGGSVAVAAGFTGVYPTASPGGWHLLGRATVAMWDTSRPRPSFIEPGDRVRFVPVAD
ncbi:MAG: Allophanate hydrolase subunit 1, partial [Ilumatobacteraceae bacterium]|nr:Allophanate hydrolase subunit 1 [Ilumatobacteraceae bacterium]